MLEDLKTRLEGGLRRQGGGKPAAVRRMPGRSLLRLVAVWTGVILATGLAVAYLHTAIRREERPLALQHIVNRLGVPMHYVLPDGSEVFLGAGSTLVYPTGFVGDERRIDLSGEAFFRVRHDAARPFVVYTDSLKTTDVGTSFKIEAFAGQLIKVAVASGKVSVSRQEGGLSRQLALLSPGGMLSWDRTAQKASVGQKDVSGLEQWTDGTLVFEREAMADVAQTLERRYGVRIVLSDPNVAQYKVSGTFSGGQPVGDILKMLSMLGKFHSEPNGKSGFVITQMK